MKPRWVDVNLETNDGGDKEDEDFNRADYIGGIGDVDLWVARNTNVLICQYEHDETYVSYYPVGAVLDHAKGTLTYLNAEGLRGECVTHEFNVHKRTLWFGSMPEPMQHRPRDIARYLALFAPDTLTEAEREEALGMALTADQ